MLGLAVASRPYSGQMLVRTPGCFCTIYICSDGKNTIDRHTPGRDYCPDGFGQQPWELAVQLGSAPPCRVERADVCRSGVPVVPLHNGCLNVLLAQQRGIQTIVEDAPAGIAADSYWFGAQSALKGRMGRGIQPLRIALYRCVTAICALFRGLCAAYLPFASKKPSMDSANPAHRLFCGTFAGRRICLWPR